MRKFLVIVFLVLYNSIVISQSDLMKFRHIGVDNGMTQNSARFMMQDSKGFVWIATEIGLNRYDGYTFEKFQYNPNDTNSLTNNYLNVLLEGDDGNIWIGTDGGGLNCYNPHKEIFTHILLDSSSNVRNNYIIALCKDLEGNVWVGTANGVFVLNLSNKEIKHITHQKNPDENHLSFLVINHLHCDSRGNIWIAPAGHGIDLYNAETGKITHLKHNPENPNSLSTDMIVQVEESKQGDIWICHRYNFIDRYNLKTKTFKHYDLRKILPQLGEEIELAHFLPLNKRNVWISTDEQGLLHLDIKEKTAQSFTHNPNQPSSLSSNNLAYLMKDNSDVLWVGSQYDGINLLDLHAKPFNHFSSFNIHESFGSAGPVIKDKDGNIWIGTLKGLYRYNPETNRTTIYQSTEGQGKSLPDNFITVLLEDSKGNIWIGTDHGLSVYDPETDKIQPFGTEQNKQLFSQLSYWALHEDSKGQVWIGTWTEGAFCYDPSNNSFKHYLNEPTDNTSISSNNIIYFFEDKNKNLWIGTWGGGACMYDFQSDSFNQFKSDPKNQNSLSHNIAMCINQDQQNNIWIGTFGGGLNKLDEQLNKFQHYTKNDGLPSDAILDMALDAKNNLWITTSHGISRFVIEQNLFQNFDVTDGLQSNEFSQHGAFLCDDGKMIFSGNKGFNYFHPDSIHLNPHKPKVVITSFKIFNKPHKEYDSSMLNEPIEFTEEVQLSWKESVFTFEFAALHYAMPEQINYAFRMKEFEEEWNYVGNKRFATYTNLPHGTYFFQVKASNNDGVWSDEITEIKLIITPPFWKTNLFYISVTLFLVLLAYSIMRYREYKLKKDKRILEQKVLERTEEIRKQNEIILEKNEELTQQKEEILTQRDQIEDQNHHLADLNKELTHQKEEIEAQRDEIQSQRDEIQKKNKNITDSIRYALRIQQSILPDKRTINKLLPQSFILYLPKDIVSGDFYWIAEKNGKILFSAIDCTGHGVPGAFMSIVGYNLLKRSVNELGITKPSEILNYLSQGINLQLRQRQEEGDVVKDGMDLALCAYDPKNKILEYAGVNNPLYLLRDNEITRFKGQRHPIGEAFTQKFLSYETQEIQMQENDLIYIFSDGYADQFGGPKRKKFLSKQFKEVLIENHELSMDEQKQKLQDAYYAWKGGNTQIDDVLVMGVKC